MKDPLQNALDKVNGVYKPPLPKFPVPVASLHDDGYYISNKSHPMARMHKINMSVFTAIDLEAYARDYAASLPKLDKMQLMLLIRQYGDLRVSRDWNPAQPEAEISVVKAILKLIGPHT